MYLKPQKIAQIHLLLRRTADKSSYSEIDRGLADIIGMSPAQVRLNSQRYKEKLKQ